MIEAAWLIPAFPVAGFILLILFGRRLGEPFAGWLATLASAGAFVSTVVVFFGLAAIEGEERFHIQTLFSWIAAGSFTVDVGLLIDPLSDHHVPVHHRRRHADPPLFDRLHARGSELLQVLHLPEPVHRLDDPAGDGRQPAADLPRLGGRWRLFLPVDLVLVHRQEQRHRRQEGLRHQPGRRLRVHAGHLLHLRRARLDQLRRHPHPIR